MVKYKAIRGGSWLNFLDLARCAYRYWFHPGARYLSIGFRVEMQVAPITNNNENE